MTRLPSSSSQDDALDHLLALSRARLTRLNPAEVLDAVQRGSYVVDIRPEFQRRRDGEIANAIIIERNHLEWRLHPGCSWQIEEAIDYGIHWIIMCDEGYASSLAAATLQIIGLVNATDMEGGFQAWRAAGLPIIPPGLPSPPRLTSSAIPDPLQMVV